MTIDLSHPRAPVVADAGPFARLRPHLRFFTMSIVWLSVVYAVSRRLDMDVFAVGLGTLLLVVPMGLAEICTSRHLPASIAKFGSEGTLGISWTAEISE